MKNYIHVHVHLQQTNNNHVRHSVCVMNSTFVHVYCIITPSTKVHLSVNKSEVNYSQVQDQ